MATATSRGTTTDRSPIQLATLVVGVTFLLVGVLGFVPGITSDYDTIQFAGHESEAKLLGLFQVSILHNLVHLLFGVAGVLAAKAIGTSRTFLIGGGAIYLVLWLFGMVIDHDAAINFVPLNTADNWLHFALGVGMVGLGFALSERRRA